MAVSCAGIFVIANHAYFVPVSAWLARPHAFPVIATHSSVTGLRRRLTRALGAKTPTTEGEPTMSEEIKDLLHTYQRVLNEADVELVGSVYTEDAVVIGQPFPTATGINAIISLYKDFLSKLDFNVEFDLLEMELSGDLGYVRTRSHGSIVPKGQKPAGTEGNREIFIVKKIRGAWKFHRYIFNAEVTG
jgi:uncharacterized protein (TIGR02246 family)